MKIIINNTKFDYNLGCRLLKAKHKNCPFDYLEEFWNDIEPITFKEIAQSIKNIEERRTAIQCLGIEKLIAEVNPILVDKETIEKRTTWVDEQGNLIEKSFTDTYELYKVENKDLFNGVSNFFGNNDNYYVKCKDTSTDRDYLIWVEPQSVYRTNNIISRWFDDRDSSKITAIQAIAWTIQTDIAEGQIEKIIRQGDCILIKPNCKQGMNINTTRHLTEKEYRELLVAES